MEMHYIMKDDKLWIPCTCKADTPNTNLHNIQCTQWHMEPDITAAPTSVLQIPEAAVAAMVKTPVAGPRAAAAAAAMIKTLAPAAVGLTPIKIPGSSTYPGAIMAVTRARNARSRVIAKMMMMTMNCNPHVKYPTL